MLTDLEVTKAAIDDLKKERISNETKNTVKKIIRCCTYR